MVAKREDRQVLPPSVRGPFPGRVGYADPRAIAAGPTFGVRLSQLRRASGLSQTQLAGDDLSPSYISLLEAGKRQPSGEVAALLAARLGCSVSTLVDGQPSERERRIQLELAYARLALSHGEAASARDRVLALLEEDLDDRALDEAQLLLATTYERLGEHGRAAELLVPLFERSRRETSHLPPSTVGVVLCGAYRDAGDLHRSATIGDEALRAAIEQGLTGTDDYFRLASTLLWVYYEIGDVAYAASWATALVEEVERAGTQTGQAAIYWNAALIADSHGRIEEALHLSQRALANLAEQGNTRDLARLRIALAQILLCTDPPRVDEAAASLATAQEQLADLGSELDRAQWDTVASTVALLRGDVAEAGRLARRAVDRMDDARGNNSSSAHVALADALRAAEQDGPAAAEYATAAARLVGDQSAGRLPARLWRDLGDRLLAAGQMAEAVQAYQRALGRLGLADQSGAVAAAIERARVGGAGRTASAMADLGAVERS